MNGGSSTGAVTCAPAEQASGQQEWTARGDSRQADVVAQVKLPHEALFDPAGRDGPCQLVVMQGHHLQPTVFVQSRDTHALVNPKTSVLIQKCHSYTRHLNSEPAGDGTNVLLHCGWRCFS